MSRRRAGYRPTAWDTLEDRQLLSRGGVAAPPGEIAARVTPSALRVRPAPRPTITVGALGDSYTDEYQFDPPHQSRARNWVEILAAKRGVDFGAFSRASRGTPRGPGFAFNWAEDGATSSDMVRDQLPGLAAQVATGEVQYAWIFIGGDDFLYQLRDVATGAIPADRAAASLAEVEATAKANFSKAVDTLLAASPGVKVVVATVPDVSLLPIVRLGTTSPQLRDLVNATGQAVRRYNATIAAAASGSDRVALVDLAGISSRLTSMPGGTFRFGGATITTTTPGDNVRNFFLADLIHLGTVGQGLVANAFVDAIDSEFGATVPPLTPRQIVQFARAVQARRPRGGLR